mmetsp:Transcript_4321/g.6593  ORF Transcript_4321/g.6593 Transcript_4321/m.6593 type:complete len:136 (+) Transcript_4321:64-471(+)|eukprot:CAMPEP_0197247626 /NCGR_PEP_ID=MMETSP1429-20130617/30170_1 /TAXON_ID=49237 /ORGANISM="Chaetoceros  sp., Strain UNC1202" /LENGTH=135 /DNA_ID=CAMNT_0042708577 /DNA_START=44 /DNA_END=451 /DNA_ORIENTATION=-
MGRRAKKAPVQTKKRVKLATRFKCPFCANEDVVECIMKMSEGTGSLSCRICDASFQMPIHHLNEPIDVFSEWLDACEAAEKGNAGGGGAGAGGSGGAFQDDQDDDGGGGKAGSLDDGKKQSYASLGLDDSEDDSD